MYNSCTQCLHPSLFILIFDNERKENWDLFLTLPPFMARNVFGKSRLTRKKNSYLSALVGLLTSQSQTDPTLDLGLRIKEIMLWYERMYYIFYLFFLLLWNLVKFILLICLSVIEFFVCPFSLRIPLMSDCGEVRAGTLRAVRYLIKVTKYYRCSPPITKSILRFAVN